VLKKVVKRVSNTEEDLKDFLQECKEERMDMLMFADKSKRNDHMSNLQKANQVLLTGIRVKDFPSTQHEQILKANEVVKDLIEKV